MNETDSMLDPTGSRRMRPAQTWWAGRSWRADRVGRNRERICRIATRRDAMPKKQSATPAMLGGFRVEWIRVPFEQMRDNRCGVTIGLDDLLAVWSSDIAIAERPRGGRAADQPDELSPLHCVPMLRRGLVRSLDRALRVSRKERPVLWAHLNCPEPRRERPLCRRPRS
jgi:hypothetical protein